LIAAVTRTHSTTRLKVKADIEALTITVKQSFYLGIIINELVTNACKYAFSAGAAGKISISVRRADDDHLKIVVADNGTGGTLPYKQGFGFTLIKAIVAQYNGSMDIATTNGATVTIMLEYAA